MSTTSSKQTNAGVTGEPSRTWTTTGAEYTNGSRRARVADEIERLDWQPFTDGMEAPACPGLAITEAIRELRLPRVSAIAWNGILSNRYGLYGVEANYTNGRARVYLLDLGSAILPLASDFWLATS